MKRTSLTVLVILSSIILTSCDSIGLAKPTRTPTPRSATATATAFLPNDTPTPQPSATSTATATPTPAYPDEGYGPTGFPDNINPLTGLAVADPTILERRPILIKVQNLPRSGRPQFGLSNADIVFEYYSEQGTTRFAALYYGQDAEKVRPIRSGRLIDINFMRAYKPVLIFGSASYQVYDRLINSEFGYRLVMEGTDTCPAICREQNSPAGYLISDTRAVADLLTKRGIDNKRQNLDGMLFKLEPPENGVAVEQFTVRFSGAIYNRWDYDATTGKYLRFSDAANDLTDTNPVYEQLVDAGNKQPIAVNNVLMILTRHNDVDPRPEVEILEVNIQGTGTAYLARDGKLYQVKWQRLAESDVITLVDDAGNLVPFKPGQTWVEVLTANTVYEQDGDNHKFTLISDWK